MGKNSGADKIEVNILRDRRVNRQLRKAKLDGALFLGERCEEESTRGLPKEDFGKIKQMNFDDTQSEI